MDDFLWDTTLYDWQTIEHALASQDEMKLSFLQSFPIRSRQATQHF